MERIPIFRVGDLLLATIPTDVRDRLLESFHGDLGATIRETGARGVLIDISAVEVIDLFMARVLERVAALGRLLGAETVLVGMRPAVALTLMELGRTLGDVPTAVNVDRGMELLRTRLERATLDDDEETCGQETGPSEEGVDHAR